MEHADSVHSSPTSVGTGRSLEGEFPGDQRKWDDFAVAGKVRFMCSFGGKIMPRPHDNHLCYLGGDSRMVSVSRNITYHELVDKLSRTFGSTVGIKYQLPSEDLDALISVTTDEDLENMMEEYDRLQETACKQSRLRIFLFPSKFDVSGNNSTSINPFIDTSKKEGWFVDALNGTRVPGVSSMPDFLFGFDNIDWDHKNPNLDRPNVSSELRQDPDGVEPRLVLVQHQTNPFRDVHSAPDSPMLGTSSSGSNSSVPCIPNLAPVQVRPAQEEGAEGRDWVSKTDEFSQNAVRTIEGTGPRSFYDNPGRGIGYRGNVDGYGRGGDDFVSVPPDIGLRTQDPKFFEDHIAKLKNYQKQEQSAENISQKEAQPSAPNPTEVESYMATERQIPIQEFEQLRITIKPQQMKTGYPNKSSDMHTDGRAMKRADSNSSLSAIGAVKMDGAQRSQDDDVRISDRAVPEEARTMTVQLNQPNKGKSQEGGLSDCANPSLKEPRSSNLETRNGDLDSRSGATYGQNDQYPLAQQAHQDHGYLPTQYDQHFLPPHYIHQSQAQPVAYYQIHHDSRIGEQSYPIYFVPAHHNYHPSSTMQPTAAVVHPVSGQPAYSGPVPRNINVVPLNASVVPQTSCPPDALSSKPVAMTMQHPTAPPLQKQPGYESMAKPVTVSGHSQFRDQQVPLHPSMVPAIPRHRAPPRPHPADIRMVYRPAQHVASPSSYSDQQYALNHHQASHAMGFENAPQQIYYTQNASIVNPPLYQGVKTTNVEAQSSAEMPSDMKGSRV